MLDFPSRKNRITPTDVVVITDPGRDPDDTVALVIAIALQKMGYLKVRMVITTLGNHKTRSKRANHVKWLFNELSQQNIPIYLGNDYDVSEREQLIHNSFLKSAKIVHQDKVQKLTTEVFKKFIRIVGNKNLIFIVLAGLTDLANLFDQIPSFILPKLKEIVFMGNVKHSVKRQHPFEPDFSSFNFSTDKNASMMVFDFINRHRIPITAVGRDIVYQNPISRKALLKLEETNNLIGQTIVKMYEESFAHLWEQVSSGQYPDRDTKWFISTFTDIKFPSDQRVLKNENLFSHVSRIMIYDAYAVLVSVPSIEPTLEFSTKTSKLKDETHFIQNKLFANNQTIKSTILNLLRSILN